MKKYIGRTLTIATTALFMVGCGGDDKALPGSEFEVEAGKSAEDAPDWIPPEMVEEAAAPAPEMLEAPDLPTNLDRTSVDATMPGFEDENGNPRTVVGALSAAVESYEMLHQMAEGSPRPMAPLTNLLQLVQYRIIRAVPAAPEGKTFVIEKGGVSLK